MAKQKTKYVCKNCGYETPRWLGKCPSCGEWSSLVEEVIVPKSVGRSKEISVGSIVRPITELESAGESRVSSGITELDRVLGGDSPRVPRLNWRGSRYR